MVVSPNNSSLHFLGRKTDKMEGSLLMLCFGLGLTIAPLSPPSTITITIF